MKEKYRNWLEEVWDIKDRIAKEPENMSIQDYWKYIQSLAKEAEREIDVLKSMDKPFSRRKS